MNHQRDLIIAFSLALAVHGVVGVCANNLLAVRHDGVPVPIFKSGESSVALTIVPTRQTTPTPPKEPEVEQPAIVEIPEEKGEVPEENPADNDADTLEKGVEGFHVEMITEQRPRYPLGSRLRGEEGTVKVKVTVNAGGRVEDVEVIESSGYSALDRAAVNDIRKARFAVSGDGSVSSGEVEVSFRFRLVD